MVKLKSWGWIVVFWSSVTFYVLLGWSNSNWDMQLALDVTANKKTLSDVQKEKNRGYIWDSTRSLVCLQCRISECRKQNQNLQLYWNILTVSLVKFAAKHPTAASASGWMIKGTIDRNKTDFLTILLNISVFIFRTHQMKKHISTGQRFYL